MDQLFNSIFDVFTFELISMNFMYLAIVDSIVTEVNNILLTFPSTYKN